MKKYLLLFASVVFIVSSFLNSFAQNCGIPFDTRTTIEVNSKADLVQKIKDYEEKNSTSGSDSSFGFSLSATLPIDGLPVPIKSGADASHIQNTTDRAIRDYEEQTSKSLSNKFYISFIPKEAFDVIKECNSLLYAPIEIKVVPTVNGSSILIDLSLKTNSQAAIITGASMRIGNELYNFKKLQDNGIIDTKKNITDKNHYAINVDAPSKTAEFRLVITTDKYTPIVIYYKNLNPPTEKIIGSRGPAIRFDCYNPQIGFDAAYNAFTTIDRAGSASSALIQFDINKSPGSKVILVDPKNDGVCTARIPDNENFIFTSSTPVLYPGGTYPAGIEMTLEISSSAILEDGKLARFTVRTKDNTAAGNIMLSLKVEYKLKK